MNKAEILIIDDESQIRKLLEITLESHDFKVTQASNAKEGIIKAANHPPDLILLDLVLPDNIGQEVLKQLREWYQKPIIILSVQSDEENIVTALDNGANDYLTKPFRTGELIARIKSSLRSFTKDETITTISTEDVYIDFTSRIVKKGNNTIKLTNTEYNLLALLAKNEGKVLTHQYLLRQIWGPGYIEQSQYLRVFIAQLRKKIEDDVNHPKIIITESGVGYRFVS